LPFVAPMFLLYHNVPDGNPKSTKPSGITLAPSPNKFPLLSKAIIGLIGLSLAS